MGRGRNGKKQEIVIEIIPETQIIAPIITQRQLERYIKMGWLEEEAIHLDRAFPRNSEGKAIIYKRWLNSPIRKLYGNGNAPPIEKRELLNYDIIDEQGFPVNYIVIDEMPLRYRRPIIGTNHTMYYEYIDSTYKLRARILTAYPKELVSALILAGKIGIMQGTKEGFGKFRVTVVSQ